MNIFITGKPGCGKSTLILELIKDLKDKNKKIAGIITPEIRERKGESREGFSIIDLASSKQEILASTKQKGPMVSKYGVNIAGIDFIVEEFKKSFNSADVIILDEIGKMEICSEKFKSMLEKVFNSKKIVIATLHRSLIEKYKDKGKLIWLEKNKADLIKKQILEEIK